MLANLRRLRCNISHPSAGQNRAGRLLASKVHMTRELIAIAASKVCRRFSARLRFRVPHPFHDQHRRCPLAVAAVITPREDVEPFNQMIFPQTFLRMKPFRFSPSRRIWSCLTGLALAVFAMALPVRAFAAEAQTFTSPQEAVKALVAAANSNDTNAMHAIFGPVGHELISPDVVQATEEYQTFVQRLTEKTQLFNHSESNVVLEIGADGWPFPIPIVKKDGQWFFDAAAGKDEVLARRIGRNETGAISVCDAYVDAQREYASQDRMGDDVFAYAQFLRSTTGTHDGLFWPANQPGETLSPLGPLIAQARVDGYHRTAKMLNDEQAPYHGYYFKILTRQGKLAPGGKYNYVINGRMIAGFGLVAWPAEWSNSGVMTFIVNQQGKVFQKNLGARTVKIAKAISAYDPDATWTQSE